jgi:hypothetical protein
MVLFDRGWYNRAGVERVMGFCSDDAYWFLLSDEEQERPFVERIGTPIKRRGGNIRRPDAAGAAHRDRGGLYSMKEAIRATHGSTESTCLMEES